MKKQEYQELVEKALSAIKTAIGENKELMETFLGWEKAFLLLPKHKETILTVKGILGFYDYCQNTGKQADFLFNAIHDMIECCNNYTSPWFAPRLERFAK